MSKAAELAALIGSQSALSNRNLLINSAMKVAQRATSVSSYSSDTFCTVDRFKVRVGSLGVYTVSQATDAPNGFEYSLKLDCTTADSSPASSDYLFLLQAIEGQDLQQLKKGTSDAESLTLSFYVKSNKTGTGQINLRDHDNDRLVGKTYTISSANTWEYKTLTFPADTTGAITSDNTSGISVEIWLDSGSDYEGGAVPTTWETRSQTDRNAAGNLNIGGSTDNEFLITGIQMEIGDVATAFEHRSFGDELAACQRYTYKATADSSYGHFGGGYGATTTIAYANIPLPVKMRAIPSLTTSGSFRNYTAANSGRAITTGPSALNSGTSIYSTQATSSSAGIGQGDFVFLAANNDADAFLLFDAEL